MLLGLAHTLYLRQALRQSQELPLLSSSLFGFVAVP